MRFIPFARTGVHLVALVASGALAADTIDAIARAELSPAFAAPPAAPHAMSPAAAEPDGAALAVIASRNVFDHGEPPPGEEPDGAPADPSLPPDACSLAIDVEGAVLVRGAPALSMAALRDRATGDVDVYQVGERISPVSTLRAVLARDDGTLDGIELAFDDGHHERCAPTLVATAVTVPAPSSPDGRAVIPEAEVKRLLDDGFTTLAASMRAIPTAGGWKLLGVPPSSVLATAGIRNGDVIKRINGHTLATATDALALLPLLKSERTFEVDLLRNETPTTLRISIQ